MTARLFTLQSYYTDLLGWFGRMASDNSNGFKFYNANTGIFVFVVFLAYIRKIVGVEKLIFLQCRLIGAQSFHVCC